LAGVELVAGAEVVGTGLVCGTEAVVLGAVELELDGAGAVVAAARGAVDVRVGEAVDVRVARCDGCPDGIVEVVIREPKDGSGVKTPGVDGPDVSGSPTSALRVPSC
jgi:hypothetical protein